MSPARSSKVPRTIPILIAVCFVSLPAYAQYRNGSGTADDPYQIATAADLIALGENPKDYDKHFILTADIDMDPNLPGRKVFDKAVIAPDTDLVEDNYQGPLFTGVFDGNSHKISHLTITGGSDLGLFGQLGPKGRVKHLELRGVDIIGSASVVGAVVGSNAGEVIDCYCSGAVKGHYSVGGVAGVNEGSLASNHNASAIQGEWAVGGVVGYNKGSLTSNRNIGPVIGERAVGGAVGYNWGEIASVSSCQNAGSISGDGSVGGLVGSAVGGVMMQCRNTGTISSSGGSSGGLVGHNSAHVSWSYSTGPVDGGESTGGLVGGNDSGGDITYSYSAGRVSGDGIVGGLVGRNKGFVFRCFWDIWTSEQTISGAGTGKTTDEMQTAATFIGWGGCDNEGVWTIQEGSDYPRLWWEDKPGEVIPSARVSDFLAGDGSEEDPYLIYTAEELNMIGLMTCDWGRHFKLMADIDLSPYTGKPFNIIGIYKVPFTGTFDGNGYTISRLNYISSRERYTGLFGFVDDPNAEVRDLGLIDPSITADSYSTGSLVGYLHNGTVRGCYVEGGAVSGSGSTGGLVGTNNGIIMRCYVQNANISGRGVGGLVGHNGDTVGWWQYEGIITDCFVQGGRVLGEYGSAGGLVGFNLQGTIMSCFTTCDVSGAFCGGLVATNGWWDEPDILGSVRGFGVIHNCYSTASVDSEGGALIRSNRHGVVINSFWDIETSGQTASDGGVGKTTMQMHAPETFLGAGWDFLDEIENGVHETWQMSDGDGYPILSSFNDYQLPVLIGEGNSESPYLISTPIELGSIIYRDHHACYRMVEDIDLFGITWSASVVPNLGGSLDGDGFAIRNLTIVGYDDLGLVGTIKSGARILNLEIVDANVVGAEDFVGILASRNNGTIINSSVAGTVSGNEYVGGLAGLNSGTLTECHSDGAVSGTTRVGGLTGRNGGSVTNAYNASSVSAVASGGGLVGSNSGDVIQCYNTGAVSGQDKIGGLVGYNYENASNSYNTGPVSGTQNTGGVVGYNRDIVKNCYSTGLVSGGSNLGGLIGDHSQDEVIHSFWNTETSGQTTSAGGIGKTTTEMQTASTFLNAGWDFMDETANGTNDIWWILEGQDYPRLWWELIAEN